jgi:hypothetical protein
MGITMPDWHAIWEYVRAVWINVSESVSDAGVWLHIYAWQTLCDVIEFFFGWIHPHPNVVSAVIYSFIIAVIALTAIVIPKEGHIHRVMVRGWNRAAAVRVWIFALVIFLANGVLHTVEQTNLLAARPLEATRIPFVAHLSINSLLSLSVNALLWFLVIFSYIRDADNWENGNTRRAFLAYFGHVSAAWASEDLISMYWEHWGTKERIGELVRWLHALSGQNILFGILALSAAVAAGIQCRTWLGEFNPTAKFMKVMVISIAVIIVIAVVAVLVSGRGSIAALPRQVISQMN